MTTRASIFTPDELRRQADQLVRTIPQDHTHAVAALANASGEAEIRYVRKLKGGDVRIGALIRREQHGQWNAGAFVIGSW